MRVAAPILKFITADIDPIGYQRRFFLSVLPFIASLPSGTHSGKGSPRTMDICQGCLYDVSLLPATCLAALYVGMGWRPSRRAVFTACAPAVLPRHSFRK